MGDLTYCTVTVKGWPWKKPSMNVVTDAYGGTWTHLETHFHWWTFRWVSMFQRCFSNSGEAKP